MFKARHKYNNYALRLQLNVYLFVRVTRQMSGSMDTHIEARILAKVSLYLPR